MTKVVNKIVDEMTTDEKLAKIIEQNTTIIDQNEEIIEKLLNLSLAGPDYSITYPD